MSKFLVAMKTIIFLWQEKTKQITDPIMITTTKQETLKMIDNNNSKIDSLKNNVRTQNSWIIPYKIIVLIAILNFQHMTMVLVQDKISYNKK